MSEWTETPLGDVGTFTRGRRFTKNDYVEKGLGCIHYGQVHTHFGPVATECLTFLPDRLRERLRFAVTGDVVIAATSENIEDLGKATAWLGSDDVAVHDDCYIFKHDLDPVFASLFFASAAFQQQKVQYAAGTKVTRISAADLARIKVSVPPLDEQRRIAGLLAAVDSLLASMEVEVVEARRVLAALRRELGELGGQVPLAALAADGGIQIGPFGSQLHAHEYTGDPAGIPVVMPQDLLDGQIVTTRIKRVPPAVARRLQRHRLQAGDIVFPRRGDLTKRALVTSDQDGWLCGTGCLRFRTTKAELAPLLAEALAGERTSEWLVEHAVGTTMLNLNTEILSKLPVADVTANPALARASASVLLSLRDGLAELTTLRSFRFALLSSLLARELELPKLSDTMLQDAS